MTTRRPAPAGQLEDFCDGRIRGRISADERMATFAALTVEIFTQGILMFSAAVERSGRDTSAVFSIPVERFPRLTLPCTMTARVAEIDVPLDGEIVLTALDDVWARMMPFRAALRGTAEGRILVGIDASFVPHEDQVFAVYDGTRHLGAMEWHHSDERGFPVFAYDLPRHLLDGLPHQLSIIHERSQLPVTAVPVAVHLSIGTGKNADLATLTDRVKTLEQRIRDLHADAFNALAVELYRHVDRMVLNQRDNFERETSAIRALLGLAARDDDAAPPALPNRLHCDFAAPLVGYGLHAVERTSTGKAFRPVAAHCGIVLPAMSPGKALLRVQGINRPHDQALDGAEVAVNGVLLEVKPYLNRKSQSWNLTALVPGGVLRSERNFVELRFPQAISDETARTDRAVGVLFVEVGPAEQPAPSAPPAGVGTPTLDEQPSQQSAPPGAPALRGGG